MTGEYKTASKDLPFALRIEEILNEQEKGEDQHQVIRRNDPCPVCRKGRLNYNGLLNLECDHCGYTLAGCST
jgi:ribosomal protein L37AE/L43A